MWIHGIAHLGHQETGSGRIVFCWNPLIGIHEIRENKAVFPPAVSSLSFGLPELYSASSVHLHGDQQSNGDVHLGTEQWSMGIWGRFYVAVVYTRKW